ncbi:hypothetical protein ABFS82_02G103700 [Erythranthe guttata]
MVNVSSGFQHIYRVCFAPVCQQHKEYEKALDARYFKEKEKDLKTKNTKPVLKTCYKIEADAADVYTRKLFLMFQEELFSSKKYMSSKHCEDGVKKCYLVMLMGKEKPVYEVVLDPIEKNAIPSCHMFEFVGILCRYILAIFVKKSFVSSLLQQYILQRWTINSKSRALQENVDELKQEDSQISSTLRRNNLLIQFLEVVEEGQKSQRKHDYLALALRTTHSELLDLDDESNETRIHGGSAIEKQPQHSGQQLSNMPVTLLDPAHVSSKGRSKSLRLKHLMESQSGKKRKCSICKQTGHIKTSCSLHKQASHVAITSHSPTMSDSFNLETLDEELPTTVYSLSTQLLMYKDHQPSSFMELMMAATKNHEKKL